MGVEVLCLGANVWTWRTRGEWSGVEWSGVGVEWSGVWGVRREDDLRFYISRIAKIKLICEKVCGRKGMDIISGWNEMR